MSAGIGQSSSATWGYNDVTHARIDLVLWGHHVTCRYWNRIHAKMTAKAATIHHGVGLCIYAGGTGGCPSSSGKNITSGRPRKDTKREFGAAIVCLGESRPKSESNALERRVGRGLESTHGSVLIYFQCPSVHQTKAFPNLCALTRSLTPILAWRTGVPGAEKM